MSSSAPCPECGAPLGADAPWGLCPLCLARQGARILAAEPPAPAAGSTAVIPPGGDSSIPSAVPSTTRFGDYELLGELARGGMGVVYRARQVSLNRWVALKMIRSGQLATTEEVQRFRLEATAAAHLDHPHIVPIYEVGEIEGRHYFTMKLIEGPDLAEVMSTDQPRMPDDATRERSGSFDVRFRSSVIAKVARAVHFAHQRGILHRDLKPTNILLTPGGEPQLTDFGLAKFIETEPGLTASHAVLGSASYMSPEQASGQTRLLTAASDVYSLGAILYEALTGRPPFRGATWVETLRAVTDSEPMRPSQHHPAADRDLETICLKCLEKEPAHRYPSAEALAEDLERWLAGEPIAARPAAAWERTLKWIRRKPVIAALAAAVALVAVAGLAGIVWQWLEAESARRFAEQKAIEETRQRGLAEATSGALRRNLYAADIALAHRALGENNLGRAVELLLKHVPRPGEEDLRGFEWRYLWKRTRGDERLTLPHDDFVETVAFSPDGRWLATTGRPLTVHIWQAESGAPITNLQGFIAAIRRGAMGFSPDGRFLVAQSDTNVCLWDTRSWRMSARLDGAEYPVGFASDGRTLFARRGREMAAWDTSTWDLKQAGPAAFANVGEFRACSSDLGNFAVASPDTQDELVQVWNVATPRRIGVVPCQIDQPKCWALASDGRMLAAGNWKGEVALWEVSTGHELRRWTAHSSPVWSLCFSPDNWTLASAGFDQVIHLWDASTQSLTGTLRGHLNEVWSVAFSPDGGHLASGSKDGTARLWSAREVIEEVTLTNALPPLMFLGDSRFLVAAKSEHLLAVWDVSTRQEIENVPVFDLGPTAVAPSTRSEIVAAAILPRLFQVWSMRNPQPTRTFVGLGEMAGTVVISPDKRHLARVDRNAVVVVDLASTLTTRLTNAAAPMAFSPDSRRFVATAPDYSLTQWEVASAGAGSSGRESAHFPPEHQDQGSTSLAAAPKLVRISVLQGHKWTISAVTFSPDGHLLVSASTDGTARLWEGHTGESVAVLASHKEGVTCAAFSPDGRTLATGSTDDTVKLWHVATGQELLTLTEFGEDIGSQSFSPDGEMLVVGCLPGTGGHRWAQVWHAPALEAIDASVAASGRTRMAAPAPRLE